LPVLAATQNVNPKQLVADICDERMRFLRGLPTWDTFGKGWGRRVKEVREFDLALVDGVAAPAKPQPSAPGPGKAKVVIPDGSRPATASGLGTLGALISQRLHEYGYSPEIVITAIILTAVAVGLGIAAWHWRAKRMQEAPA